MKQNASNTPGELHVLLQILTKHGSSVEPKPLYCALSLPGRNMIKPKPVIAWFRQDLRLSDNPALSAAIGMGAPVLPVFVLDDDSAGEWSAGAASRWWLHESLASLDTSLDGNLQLFRGRADLIIPELVEKTGASGVTFNRCYEPWRVNRDRELMNRLRDRNTFVGCHNGSLLFDPQSITTRGGTPYRVFTPYYRKGCLEGAPPPRKPLEPTPVRRFSDAAGGLPLADLELMPTRRWYDGMARAWSPGEQGATLRLREFLDNGIAGYADGRNVPAQAFVSRLSPHLHFGEISPNQAWYAAADCVQGGALRDDLDVFRSELGWREFSHYTLYHYPELPHGNLQRRFDRFPWITDRKALRRWQDGQTGIPIVDAGMRELWQTGYMHNRVRMIAASFLVKNLMQHWHHGANWFWDTLVDADLANNSAGWQWVAGSGADAAPYFRIFNPVTQGNRFDPDGEYVRRFVPEIATLPDKYVHCPWDAPANVLADSGVVLGETYPTPIVDLKASRLRALAAYREMPG